MDVIVTKVDPTGHTLWSTFIGGNGYDRAYAVEVDHLGFILVAGRAGAGFPTTPGTLQPAFEVDPALPLRAGGWVRLQADQRGTEGLVHLLRQG